MNKKVSNSSACSTIVVILICFSFVGCGSSGGSSGDDAQQVELTLGSKVRNVQLQAGVPLEFRFTYDIPGSITESGDFKVDLAGTLKNASLSAGPISGNRSLKETLILLARALIKDALAAEMAQVTAHISYAGDADVCSSPTVFGPYGISGAIGMALTSSTETVTPTQRSIDIMNSGSIEVCIVTTPPIDAYATVTAIEGEVEPCAEATVDIAPSNWSGTYRCDNFGVSSDPPGSPISLSISRNPDGSYKYIDDGGAEYNGHLCGNKFRFNGGIPGSFTESGTLKFSSNDKATKTSTWNGIPVGIMGGDCKDILERI